MAVIGPGKSQRANRTRLPRIGCREVFIAYRKVDLMRGDIGLGGGVGRNSQKLATNKRQNNETDRHR